MIRTKIDPLQRRPLASMKARETSGALVALSSQTAGPQAQKPAPRPSGPASTDAGRGITAEGGTALSVPLTCRIAPSPKPLRDACTIHHIGLSLFVIIMRVLLTGQKHTAPTIEWMWPLSYSGSPR